MKYLVDCYDASKTFIDTVEIVSDASLIAVAKTAAKPTDDLNRPSVAIARIHNESGGLIEIVKL